jgi:hypothetical protein
MAWITPTIAAVGALGSLGAAALGQGRNNQQAQGQYQLQLMQLMQDQQNQRNQQAVQAMVNQRAVAGTSDSFGTTTQYDPATNTWRQVLGKLPMQADTAAINANMTRNTTDLMQQELANRVAMTRAAQAGPMADTAQRQLQNFRPMSSDQLTALMSQQGIEAARQAYDPLRADTLRAVARTGTAAGPVIRQLGLGEAQNLRNTLNEAQLSGLTNAAGINNTNYQRLLNAATGTQTLATPQLAQGNLGTSASDQLLQQLTANRAQWAPSSTAQGAAGANYAAQIAGQGTAAAAGAYPNTNFGLDQTISGLKNISQFASNTGSGGMNALLQSLFGSSSNPNYAGAPSGANIDPSTISGAGQATSYDASSWVPQNASQYNF